MRNDKAHVEQLDRGGGQHGPSQYRQFMKRRKRRLERRRGKVDPGCRHGYNRYSGYE